MALPCVHCGRNIAADIEVCPYCRKNPRPPQPPPAGSESTGPKISYRLQFKPKNPESETKEEKSKPQSHAILHALTLGSDEDRETALDYLLGADGQLLVRDLVEALQNPAISGREYIAKALGRMGSRSCVPALMEALDSSDLSLRLAAAWALLRIGDAKALPVILDHLKDQDPRVRRYFAYVAGGMGDPSAAPFLKNMLEDPDAEVREQAVLSLAALQGKNEARAIQKARKDANPLVRRIAQEVARSFGTSYEGWKKTLWLSSGIALGALLVLGILFLKRLIKQ